MADFGIATGGFHTLKRNLAFRVFSKMGIQRIEPGAYPDALDNWIDDPAALKKELDTAGIRYDSVHIARAAWDLAAEDKDQRRAAIDAGLASLQQCAELGARVVVTHPNRDKIEYKEGTRERDCAWTRDALTVLADEARNLGLKLALENMSSHNPARPATTITEVQEFIAPHRDVMGICLDTGHTHASGLNLAEEIRAAGADLLNIHIHDNHGQSDEHLRPGRGTIDWDAFLSALQDIHYQGLLTFEVIAKGLPLGMLNCVRRLQREWGARL